jgi:hypothetical protein
MLAVAVQLPATVAEPEATMGTASTSSAQIADANDLLLTSTRMAEGGGGRSYKSLKPSRRAQ